MIQFATPWILWGSFLAAAPILIHLFGRRRTKNIEFSSLRFLKAMQREQLRTLKLKQIILLILRTLLLLLLVFAFAGPRFTPSSAQGTSSSSALIVLDNSISTSARTDGVVYFERLKRLAEDVVRTTDTYETVAWTTLLDSRPPLITSGPEVPQNFLDELQPLSGDLDIAARITDIQGWLAEQNLGHADIYLVTDSQQSQFLPLQNYEVSSEASSRWFVISPDLNLSQAGIRDVEFSDELLQPGGSAPLSLYIHRSDSVSPPSTGIQIFQNGEKIGQTLINWDNSLQESATFQVPLNETGFFQLEAVLDDDEYGADNHWYLNGRIPEALTILLVSDSEDGRYFAGAALNSFANNQEQISYSSVTSDQLFQALTNQVDVIILSDARITGDMGNLIRQEVESGTGLMVFPGNQTLQENSLQWLSNVSGENRVQLNEGTFQEVTSVQWGHPVFRRISQKSPEQIQLPRIFQYIPLNSQGGQTLMRMASGNPLLQETSVGQGIIWVWAVGTSLNWSDLPRRGLFVPVFFRGLYYLSGSGNRYDNLLYSGQPIRYRLPAEIDATELTLINPAGQTIILPVINSAVSSVETDQPGHYSLYSGEELLALFSVNVSPDERDLTRLQESGWVPLLGKNFGGVIQIDAEQDRIEMASLVRGYPLHQWGFLLALLCVIIEMIMVRGKPGEKKGIAV